MGSKALFAILAFGYVALELWAVGVRGGAIAQEPAPVPHNNTYQLYQLGLKVNEHAIRLTQIEQRLGNIEHALSDARGGNASSDTGSSAGGYGVVRPEADSDAVHRVAKGDNLTRIARRYGVSVPAIVRANSLRSPDRLAIGQRLVIPNGRTSDEHSDSGVVNGYGDTTQDLVPNETAAASGVHVVRKNETLFSIAKHHGVSVRELQAYNGIPNPAEIWAGQQIRIPGDLGNAAEVDLSDADWKAPDQPASPQTQASDHPPVAEPTALTHRVRSGETLDGIARRFGVSVRTIQSLNAIDDPDRLAVGQVLLVPTTDEPDATTARVRQQAPPPDSEPADSGPIDASPSEFELVEMGSSNVNTGREFFGYFVVTGDTVEKVASVFGTTPDVLRQINDLPPDGELTPGEQILIPAEAVYGS